MRHVPHLVLDGALAVAAAVRARRVIVVADDPAALTVLASAMAERSTAGIDQVTVELVRGRGRFVSGEARAVADLLAGGVGAPPGRRVHLTDHGLDGRSTFLSNVETSAHIGLLVTHGAFDYSATGCADEPGTSLVTVTGAVGRPAVIEVPNGIPLSVLLPSVGASDGEVLVGGYHGAWLEDPGSVTVSRPGLARVGGTFGAGTVTVLDDLTCPIGEIARVARWLAGESMRQCGPCMFGLDGIADDMAALAAGDSKPSGHLAYLLAITPGRGACAHPDGAIPASCGRRSRRSPSTSICTCDWEGAAGLCWAGFHCRPMRLRPRIPRHVAPAGGSHETGEDHRSRPGTGRRLDTMRRARVVRVAGARTVHGRRVGLPGAHEPADLRRPARPCQTCSHRLPRIGPEIGDLVNDLTAARARLVRRATAGIVGVVAIGASATGIATVAVARSADEPSSSVTSQANDDAGSSDQGSSVGNSGSGNTGSGNTGSGNTGSGNTDSGSSTSNGSSGLSHGDSSNGTQGHSSAS